MTVRRFFVDKIAPETAIAGEEYAHAKNVLRLGVGDEVVLLDGSGQEYDAVICRAEKGALYCNVTGGKPSDKEPKARVRLMAGALKGERRSSSCRRRPSSAFRRSVFLRAVIARRI